jgi:hypothetical protein
VINSPDNANCSWANEAHCVTFFAPDRPVDGTTVYAVEDGNEPAERIGGESLLQP